jgi:EAL domain-containing protein (putative c-di-GMP-specific phosphodiesterase class I)
MSVLAPRYATDWVRMLARALRGEGVAIHFQPIVDLERGQVVGHEALLRFPGHAVGSPAEWVDAAHAHGCGAELEALAIRLALDARRDLPADTFLSVNVAPAVLPHPAIRDAFADAALDGVVVELTEHSRVEHYGVLAAELERLRSAGGVIAVDDTGAGYAGLHHLISVRPEIIKLDRTLVAGIDRDRPRRALVEMFGAFANRFDAWVLAEGVETTGELGTLRQIGVPLAQGYLLGRPAPGWSDVSIEARDHLRTLERARTGDTLRLLVESQAPLPGPPGVTALDDLLRIDVDTPVAEAAHRALNRAEPHRWAPVLCIDGQGRFVGVVRMERLVEQLAVAATTAS